MLRRISEEEQPRWLSASSIHQYVRKRGIAQYLWVSSALSASLISHHAKTGGFTALAALLLGPRKIYYCYLSLLTEHLGSGGGRGHSSKCSGKVIHSAEPHASRGAEGGRGDQGH